MAFFTKGSQADQNLRAARHELDEQTVITRLQNAGHAARYALHATISAVTTALFWTADSIGNLGVRAYRVERAAELNWWRHLHAEDWFGPREEFPPWWVRTETTEETQ